jgi:hypothetical protein
MVAFGTQVRLFEPGRSRLIFQGEKILSMPSFGKITGNFSPMVPLSLLEVSRVVVDVGAPGGASGNFQSIG